MDLLVEGILLGLFKEALLRATYDLGSIFLACHIVAYELVLYH